MPAVPTDQGSDEPLNVSGNRRGMSAPASRYPRTYLLAIYNQALEAGMLHIHPISEPDAETLTRALYNLRRRSGAAHASFITPEMHLVSAGQWRPDNGGTLPIYYSETDLTLPTITPLHGEALATELQMRPQPPSPAAGLPSAADIDIAFDVDAYVRDLQNKASDGD